MRRQRQFTGILLGTLAAVTYFTRAHFFPAPGVVHAQTESSGPAREGAGYVAPEACAGCHRNIWETYRRTGMARSFYRPSPTNTVEDYTENNTFYHKASDSYFTMLRRDGKYYQRRHQIDFDGKQVNVIEKQVDYILGSGNHVR